MKIISNEKIIRRNARIGQISSLVALVVLGVGMYISFKLPNQFGVAVTALLIGFTLSQIGIYFGNRWGRQPRPDQVLDKGLKGLPGDYNLYHYVTPASHLFIGPAGVWFLMTQHQRGTITFDGKRWRQKSGGFLQGYMRLFGQEGIGRPDLETGAEIESLQRFLKKKISDRELPPIRSVLVFTDPRVEIRTSDTPIPALPIIKLKEFIRKQAKEKPISSSVIVALKGVFPE